MKNKDNILRIINKFDSITVNQLVDELGISRQAIHRTLNTLQDEKKIIKSGKPPKVFYSLVDTNPSPALKLINVNKKTQDTINREFIYITPLGSRMVGWDGFVYWCNERKMDTTKTANKYIQTINKYNHYKKNGLIDGLHKMRTSFKDVALDNIFYLDFYSIEIFGKTKLGQLLLFAKQSQDRKMMNEISEDIKPTINRIINDYKIDGVGFIPPTVKRELQFMKQLQNKLNLNTKIVDLVKIKTPVVVPQKTLTKLQDRVMNADNTIAVNDSGTYNNILLIDDAVGSGATLNEVAKKMRDRKMCKGKIIGLAIVGSFKGFEVISEI